jgi:hypothetical protein
MVAQSLVCPQCGGQLDPMASSSALIHCTYCGATALLDQGRARTFRHYRKRSVATVDEARAKVDAQMKKMGLSGSVEGREVAVPYLVRPVRMERQSNVMYMHSEWWVNFKEGFLGIPLEDGSPVPVLHALDADEFEEQTAAVPLDLRLQTENFEDRVRLELSRAMSSQDDLYLLWQGDFCLVDLPLAVFDLDCPIPDGERPKWRNLTDDDRYRAVYDLHGGKMLEWNTPFRKGPGVNKVLIVAVVVALLLLFVLPVVAAVLAFLLPFLIAIMGAVFAAVVA